MSEKIKYRANGNTYNIPIDKKESFLTKNPDAQKVFSYKANDKTYGIPENKLDSFLEKFPDAKPLDETIPQKKKDEQSEVPPTPVGVFGDGGSELDSEKSVEALQAATAASALGELDVLNKIAPDLASILRQPETDRELRQATDPEFAVEKPLPLSEDGSQPFKGTPQEEEFFRNNQEVIEQLKSDDDLEYNEESMKFLANNSQFRGVFDYVAEADISEIIGIPDALDYARSKDPEELYDAEAIAAKAIRGKVEQRISENGTFQQKLGYVSSKAFSDSIKKFVESGELSSESIQNQISENRDNPDFDLEDWMFKEVAFKRAYADYIEKEKPEELRKMMPQEGGQIDLNQIQDSETYYRMVGDDGYKSVAELSEEEREDLREILSGETGYFDRNALRDKKQELGGELALDKKEQMKKLLPSSIQPKDWDNLTDSEKDKIRDFEKRLNLETGVKMDLTSEGGLVGDTQWFGLEFAHSINARVLELWRPIRREGAEILDLATSAYKLLEHKMTDYDSPEEELRAAAEMGAVSQEKTSLMQGKRKEQDDEFLKKYRAQYLSEFEDNGSLFTQVKQGNFKNSIALTEQAFGDAFDYIVAMATPVGATATGARLTGATSSFLKNTSILGQALKSQNPYKFYRGTGYVGATMYLTEKDGILKDMSTLEKISYLATISGAEGLSNYTLSKYLPFLKNAALSDNPVSRKVAAKSFLDITKGAYLGAGRGGLETGTVGGMVTAIQTLEQKGTIDKDMSPEEFAHATIDGALSYFAMAAVPGTISAPLRIAQDSYVKYQVGQINKNIDMLANPDYSASQKQAIINKIESLNTKLQMNIKTLAERTNAVMLHEDLVEQYSQELQAQNVALQNIEEGIDVETNQKDLDEARGNVDKIEDEAIKREEEAVRQEKEELEKQEAEQQEQVTQIDDALSAIESLDDNEVVTNTVETLEEVPEVFRDKAEKKEAKEVEFKQTIFGIPYGKTQKKTVAPEAYQYSATAKELKDFLNEKKESLLKVEETEQTQAAEEEPTSKILDSLNPTGTLFSEYSAEERDKMPLGDDITTYNETANIAPDDKVTVYRGVPSKDAQIQSGDFVTTNQQLAKDYAGEGEVISRKVRADEILDDKTEPLGEEYILRIKQDVSKTQTKDKADKSDKKQTPEVDKIKQEFKSKATEGLGSLLDYFDSQEKQLKQQIEKGEVGTPGLMILSDPRVQLAVIQAAKKAAQGAETVSKAVDKAVEAGIKALRETQQYKDLKNDEKVRAESDVRKMFEVPKSELDKADREAPLKKPKRETKGKKADKQKPFKERLDDINRKARELAKEAAKDGATKFKNRKHLNNALKDYLDSLPEFSKFMTDTQMKGLIKRMGDAIESGTPLALERFAEYAEKIVASKDFLDKIDKVEKLRPKADRKRIRKVVSDDGHARSAVKNVDPMRLNEKELKEYTQLLEELAAADIVTEKDFRERFIEFGRIGHEHAREKSRERAEAKLKQVDKEIKKGDPKAKEKLARAVYNFAKTANISTGRVNPAAARIIQRLRGIDLNAFEGKGSEGMTELDSRVVSEKELRQLLSELQQMVEAPLEEQTDKFYTLSQEGYQIINKISDFNKLQRAHEILNGREFKTLLRDIMNPLQLGTLSSIDMKFQKKELEKRMQNWMAKNPGTRIDAILKGRKGRELYDLFIKDAAQGSAAYDLAMNNFQKEDGKMLSRTIGWAEKMPLRAKRNYMRKDAKLHLLAIQSAYETALSQGIEEKTIPTAAHVMKTNKAAAEKGDSQHQKRIYEKIDSKVWESLPKKQNGELDLEKAVAGLTKKEKEAYNYLKQRNAELKPFAAAAAMQEGVDAKLHPEYMGMPRHFGKNSLLEFKDVVDAAQAFSKEGNIPESISVMAIMSSDSLIGKVESDKAYRLGGFSALNNSTRDTMMSFYLREPNRQNARIAGVLGRNPKFDSQYAKPLKKSVVNATADKMNAKEWEKELSPKGRGKVWRDLKGFLKEKGNATVSKQELIKFLNENKVELFDTNARAFVAAMTSQMTEVNKNIFAHKFYGLTSKGEFRQLLNYLKELGYFAALSSVHRGVTEFTSNVVHAMFDPVTFGSGIKEMFKATKGQYLNKDRAEFEAMEKTSELMNNPQHSRIFFRGASIHQETGIGTGSLLDRTAITRGIKNINMATVEKGDRMVALPMWVGSMKQNFKQITGEKFDFVEFAKQGEYYNKHFTAAQEAANEASQKVAQGYASMNPYETALVTQARPDDNLLKIADKYMARFRIAEARSMFDAVDAMLGNDTTMTRGEGLRLGLATVMRMAAYDFIMTSGYNGMAHLGQMLLGEDYEPEDTLFTTKDLEYKIKKSLYTGLITPFVFRRLGNLATIPVSELLEYANFALLGDGHTLATRAGDYTGDFNQKLMFTAIPRRLGAGRKPIRTSKEYFKSLVPITESSVGSYGLMLSGPYSNFLKSMSKGADVGFDYAFGKPSAARAKKLERFTGYYMPMLLGASMPIPLPKDLNALNMNITFREYREKKKPTGQSQTSFDNEFKSRMREESDNISRRIESQQQRIDRAKADAEKKKKAANERIKRAKRRANR